MSVSNWRIIHRMSKETSSLCANLTISRPEKYAHEVFETEHCVPLSSHDGQS